MGQRILALAMDTVLVGAFAAFLLVKILLPREHPEGVEQFVNAYHTYESAFEQAVESGEETPSPPDFSENTEILEMAAFVQQTLLLVFFLYFGACEWLMAGSSLGKRTFGLRTVMLGSPFPPTPLQALLRAAIKTFALVAYPPFTWLLFFLALLVPGRRAGHDLLARTVVIQENPPLPPKGT